MDYNETEQSQTKEARRIENWVTCHPINQPRPQEEQEDQRLNEIHVDSKFKAYTLLTSALKEERKEIEEYFTQWTNGNYSSSFGNFLQLKRAEKAAKERQKGVRNFIVLPTLQIGART